MLKTVKVGKAQKVVTGAMDNLVKNWKYNDGKKIHSVIIFGFSENGMSTASKIHGELIDPMALKYLGKAADNLGFEIMMKVAESKIQQIIAAAKSEVKKDLKKLSKKA
jgi:hypothetical protein